MIATIIILTVYGIGFFISWVLFTVAAHRYGDPGLYDGWTDMAAWSFLASLFWPAFVLGVGVIWAAKRIEGRLGKHD